MKAQRTGVSLTLCVLLLTSLFPVVAQTTSPPTVDINVHWLGPNGGENAHAYLLTFSDNGTYELDIQLEQQRNGSLLPTAKPSLGKATEVCARPW